MQKSESQKLISTTSFLFICLVTRFVFVSNFDFLVSSLFFGISMLILGLITVRWSGGLDNLSDKIFRLLGYSYMVMGTVAIVGTVIVVLSPGL